MNPEDIKFLVYMSYTEVFKTFSTIKEAEDYADNEDEIFMVHGATKGVREYTFKVKEVIE